MFSTPLSLLILPLIILRTLIALSRSNWILIWISLEINLLRFIPVIILNNPTQESEAAVTYFLAQSLGSAIILYSRICTWSHPLYNLSMFLLVFSLLLKLGAAPCHFWFPSVMISLNWINCLILTTWQKLAPLSLLAFLTRNRIKTENILLISAALSAITGGLMGINQCHIRIIIAYSSITHLGWIIGAIYRNQEIICIVYFSLYCIIISPIFILLDSINITSSSQFLSSSSNILIPLSLLILLFLSLAGIPPLTGFIPKWLIISFLASYRPWLLLSLLMGSFINLYFYLNLTLRTISRSIISQLSNKPLINKLTISIIILSRTASLGFIPLLIYAMTLFY